MVPDPSPRRADPLAFSSPGPGLSGQGASLIDGAARRALSLLSRHGDSLSDRPGWFLLKARAHADLGMYGQAAACLDLGLAKFPDHPALNILSWRVMTAQEDPDGAARACEALLARCPGDPVLQQAGQRFLSGLDEPAGDGTPPPDPQAPDALDQLDRLLIRLDDTPDDPLLLIETARACAALGRFREAFDLLQDLRGHKAARAALGAEIALRRGFPGTARALIDRALTEEDSPPASLWQLQGVIAAALGDRVVARAAQARARQSGAPPTPQDYILWAMAALGADEDLRPAGAEAPQDRAATHFATRLAATGNLAHAVLLLSALLRAGHIGPAPEIVRATRGCIPRQVFQVSNTIAPPRTALIDRNRPFCAGTRFRAFGLGEAPGYLGDRAEDRALRAFHATSSPRAQGDLFRLALLCHEGGICLGAEALCLQPLDTWMKYGLRLIAVQADALHLETGFIAAEPGHPALRAALDAASERILKDPGANPWAATGPGILTRALARHATTRAGHLQDGTWIMPAWHRRSLIALPDRGVAP